MKKDALKKFIPFAKVDAARREVWGIVTAEVPDKDDEVCDYDKSKPYYEAVITEMGKATDGRNFFPLREMHGLKAAGKCVAFELRDQDKEVFMGFKVVDDEAWKKVEENVYTGFSQGGSKVGSMVPDPVYKGCMRYVANPSECSLVDNPCLGAAHFAYVKADGSVEMRKFAHVEESVSVPLSRFEKIVDEVRLLKGKVLGKYSDDQPRDDKGQFASGGSSSGGSASGTGDKPRVDHGKHANEAGDGKFSGDGGNGFKTYYDDRNIESHDKHTTVYGSDKNEVIVSHDRATGKVNVEPAKFTAHGGESMGEHSFKNLEDAAAHLKDRWGITHTFVGKGNKSMKTKKVSGEDLLSSSFALVIKANDPATWRFPLKFCDAEKTRRHILAAFAKSQSLDVSLEPKLVRARVAAAAKENGIDLAIEKKKLVEIQGYLRKQVRVKVNKLSRLNGDIGHSLSFLDDDLGKLAKGMGEVSRLACHVQELGYLFYGALAEQAWEQDSESKVPDLLEGNINDLLDTLLLMAQEEAQELREEVAGRRAGMSL